ncbi:PhoD-like phosphatase [Nitzschia inconspicua]|uniref:PhoD-like phosphatase n=1 Tax=Nitzschia inconspicua TaxID=303405 RepID=A0A9K3PN67_9STRA|nr:PhoD-like phosphatase [Nitzschia inconspicua]
MHLNQAVYLLSSFVVPMGVFSQELPITTTDVFIQSGEVSADSVVIMARCNSEEESSVSLFLNGEVQQEATVTNETDFTISFKVERLESNVRYTYSVQCTAISTAEARQEPLNSMEGSFKTAPAADDAAPVSFVWVADLAGQGWGRNPNFEITSVGGKTVSGGYVVFDTMEDLGPDFALFQGDMIYADNAIPASQEIPTGGNWTNNPTKDFVAVTLDDFRHNWKYNHGDEKMQSFLAKTPIFVQWDDHEVTNNWYPNEILVDPLYDENTPANRLYENSLRALYEFNPIEEGSSIFRSQKFGKHLEIFFLDFRSFRDPNPENEAPEPSAMMGDEQLQWLKDGLSSSNATWKILSSHDPLGIVTGGEGDRDSFGNESPEILGREHELKDLLAFIHDNDILGVVSLTSDVHFTAHVNMDPSRAEGGFTDFKPLDEYVIGPIHAGSFGPNFMDTSFGAIYEYELGPLTLGFERWANLPPSEFRLQSFGHASVDEDGNLTIKLIGIDGEVKLEKKLSPEVSNGGSNPSGASSMVFSHFIPLVSLFLLVLN